MDDRAEESVMDARSRLLIDAIVDYGICLLDRDGRVMTWGAGAETITGYAAAEIVGEHFGRFFTAEEREKGEPARALEIAAREGRHEFEGWRLRKDGARVWVNVVIDRICDPSGALAGFAEVTRDLTERRRAEQELRQNEQQFELLVKGVTDYAIFMLDPNGRVVSWNPGAQRIKGYAPEEIIGKHFSLFYTDEDRRNGEPKRALEIATRDGRCEREGWRVRRDGTRFCASVVIDAIRNPNGAIIGFAKITRDITERVETQRALDQARDALVQSQKMEAIGQLTGGIAHDFNNLLTAILGSLELLRRRLPEEQRTQALIDNAVMAARRGASLTQRMLAFARRQELELAPTHVAALAHGMTGMVRQCLGASIAIETRFPFNLSPVWADANQLEVALLNLLVNARDAMPDGGSIIIAAREESVAANAGSKHKPGRYVCLSVADSGEGMDEEALAHATEPFFTTKGTGKGTGLGLSMVQGMTEQSGGRLVLKSRKGIGTTVELWLPVAEPEAAGKRDYPTPSAKRATRALVIIAVDDDDLVLLSTRAMLEDLGHVVLPATSGKQALEILRREKTVDVVITDQAMPQMTGLQLSKAIKAEWPELPIVVATGHAELPPEAGIHLPRLSKPFRQEDIAQALAAVV